MTNSPSSSSVPTVANSPSPLPIPSPSPLPLPLPLPTSMENNDTNFQKLLGMHKEVLAITKDQSDTIHQMIQMQQKAHQDAWETVNKTISNQETSLSMLSKTLKFVTHQSSLTCQPSTSQSPPHSRIQPSLQSRCTSYCRRYLLFTSKGTYLSEASNWIYPVERFYRPCLICRYYGHGFDDCPNIKKAFIGSCLRCYYPDHNAKSCPNKKRNPPFKEGYISPEKLINSITGSI